MLREIRAKLEAMPSGPLAVTADGGAKSRNAVARPLPEVRRPDPRSDAERCQVLLERPCRHTAHARLCRCRTCAAGGARGARDRSAFSATTRRARRWIRTIPLIVTAASRGDGSGQQSTKHDQARESSTTKHRLNGHDTTQFSQLPAYHEAERRNSNVGNPQPNCRSCCQTTGAVVRRACARLWGSIPSSLTARTRPGSALAAELHLRHTARCSEPGPSGVDRHFSPSPCT